MTRQLRRVVDGAIRDCLNQHPEYFTRCGAKNARRSILKRVVGSLTGYAAQAARGRSGADPAAASGLGIGTPSSPTLASGKARHTSTGGREGHCGPAPDCGGQP